MEDSTFVSTGTSDQLDLSTRKRKRRGDDGEHWTETAASNVAAFETQQATNNDTPSSPSSEIIGLEFMDGRVLYCHRSTLVNAGGYFAVCFGDNGFFAGSTYIGKMRSAHLLSRTQRKALMKTTFFHSLSQRRSHKITFHRSPLTQLFGVVFDALDGLFERLYVTHSCPYSQGDDRGVLYWLGTNKGRCEYKNPQMIGAIGVYIGGIEDITGSELEALDVTVDKRAFTQKSRAALVQYRPPVGGFSGRTSKWDIWPRDRCYSLWNGMSLLRFPTVFDLRSVKLRLTAYSIRCDWNGMTDWNLEASQDGTDWVILHEARNERCMSSAYWLSILPDLTARFVEEDDDNSLAISQDFADQELRATWKIAAPTDVFFRYFRIIGSGSDYERAEGSSDNLHGVGLELYGDVHEE